ncbi:hypothetical protein L873DRAFT_1322946 [Choiromyces venosus 120613-1]|uniref:Secreted protein n=1 Tax=Choiromyces venosus 120613-1 TaxID=1336337 RepID=A0A3N4JF26_9PEZI|nr:hypothetical protein L873DRAFT_1322946 [Choiromyces venosus 120613-1]
MCIITFFFLSFFLSFWESGSFHSPAFVNTLTRLFSSPSLRPHLSEGRKRKEKKKSKRKITYIYKSTIYKVKPKSIVTLSFSSGMS